ncbi:MAG: AAA family ATPase [Streptosporangiales bacterium]|nr:AAA family ATPase [Streptosporangiales bacterium]
MSDAGRPTPAELARLLGLREPTAEQARVIAGDLEPTVVVAGAGSGKSETMAARVVWLVACGLVRPERVLGLTFTRKAAAELAMRIRQRLDQLRRLRLAEPSASEAGALGVLDPDVLDGEPTVSTYHAYAARLVTDHALREALEPSTRLVTPAVQWQIAARVVAGYDGPVDALGWTPATVTAAVLELAGEIAEHLSSAEDVRALGARLREDAADLPGRLPADVTRLLRCQEAREQLLPLVERYREEKARREVIDHDDQVALAARIASRHPEVGTIERSRYAAVLLDEYQDTGHSQLVLLRSLFGNGYPVTAVGDPCQSIYGWRGASAGNLRRFPVDFPVVLPARRGGRAPAGLAQLGVSFRNGERILSVASVLSEDLRAEDGQAPRLRPGQDQDGRGHVVCGLFETAQEEAEWIASRIDALLHPSRYGLPEELAPDGRPWPSSTAPAEDLVSVQPADVAVLARKRAQLPALRRALADRGIPVEVVGLGGLLGVPEVQDVVATLRALDDPGAGDALARLLTGPRWRIGAADLVALGRRARELARLDDRDTTLARDLTEKDEAVRFEFLQDHGQLDVRDPLQRLLDDLGAGRHGSLVDALDDLGPPEAYSPAGYARLSALARELRVLRTRVGLPLPDLVTEVERVLGLDIELAARPGADPVAARADLDAFVVAAAHFHSNEEGPTLGAFLAYLRAAEDHEFGLEVGRVSETNSVKLMTVHAAKGLQWPVVVVPGLAAGERARVFPASPRTSARWTDNPRKLPFPLRGDRDDLPRLNGLDKRACEDFVSACRRRDELEERRLAYVAATRASYLLLCSGYWWGETRARLGPSVFLAEVRRACEAGAGEVAAWAPEPAPDAENPGLAEPVTAHWPSAPSGPRHVGVAEGALLVEQALAGAGERWLADLGDEAGSEDEAAGRAAAWGRDERLLLAERAAAAEGGARSVELPRQLSVSSMVALARDPSGAELAREIRRPLPRPPAPRARRGTSFHRWLEARYGQQRLIDDDDLLGAADEGVGSDADLAELQRRFLASPWAERTPVEVEVPFETVVGDRLVRGRMDAVFLDADGGHDVVDWKTGLRPDGPGAEAAAVQLAAYRLAWAELADVPVERVRAAFYYVRTGETVRPVDLLDAAGLAALVERVPEAR